MSTDRLTQTDRQTTYPNQESASTVLLPEVLLTRLQRQKDLNQSPSLAQDESDYIDVHGMSNFKPLYRENKLLNSSQMTTIMDSMSQTTDSEFEAQESTHYYVPDGQTYEMSKDERYMTNFQKSYKQGKRQELESQKNYQNLIQRAHKRKQDQLSKSIDTSMGSSSQAEGGRLMGSKMWIPLKFAESSSSESIINSSKVLGAQSYSLIAVNEMKKNEAKYAPMVSTKNKMISINNSSLPKITFKQNQTNSPKVKSVLNSAAHNQYRLGNYTEETMGRLINVSVATQKVGEDMLQLRKKHESILNFYQPSPKSSSTSQNFQRRIANQNSRSMNRNKTPTDQHLERVLTFKQSQNQTIDYFTKDQDSLENLTSKDIKIVKTPVAATGANVGAAVSGVVADANANHIIPVKKRKVVLQTKGPTIAPGSQMVSQKQQNSVNLSQSQGLSQKSLVSLNFIDELLSPDYPQIRKPINRRIQTRFGDNQYSSLALQQIKMPTSTSPSSSAEPALHEINNIMIRKKNKVSTNPAL